MRWALSISVAISIAAAASGETREIRTAHFTVVCDAGAGVGREIADNLEIFRGLLEDAFPGGSGRRDVVVHAVSNERGMAELLPALWENGEARRPDGIFREGPDKDYIVARLDAPSETAYSTLYHEYFHAFARARYGRLPLWVDEGLAKFWEMTSIEADRVRIGVPSRRNAKILADEPALPLPVLFAIDRASPYYLEPGPSALFYAQTWAVAHYLLLGDASGERRGQLLDYLREPREEAFGDLRALAAEVHAHAQKRVFGTIERERPRTENARRRVRTLSDAEALAARGEFLVYGASPERARPVLERAVALDPTIAMAHEGLGFLSLHHGRVDEALAAFSRAAELDSSSFLAHYYRAVASLRADASIETVLAYLDASLRANPDFAPAHLLVATAIAEHGDDYARGIASAKRAVSLTPNDPEAHRWLGRLLVADGDAIDGIEIYRHALELEGPEPDVYRELAFDFLDLDLFDDAGRALEHARKLAPDDADTAFALALTLSEAGRVDAAIDAFEDAIRLDGEIARYHYRLGELLVEQARFGDAAVAFERALDIEPATVAARRALGHALLAGGRPEDAIPHLRAAVERAPRVGILHFQLATALQATGAAKEADEHFLAAEELGYQPE